LNMDNKKCIVLFGPDGCGKSSLARILSGKLNAKISWMRGSHLIASLIASMLSKFKVFRGSDNPYYNIRIPGKLLKLWIILEFFSAIIIFLVKYVVRRRVIGDRGLPDFIAWITLTTNYRRFHSSIFGRITYSLTTHYCKHIYVRCEAETIYSRRGGEVLIDPYKQLIVYDGIAKILESPVIDTTNKSIEESMRRIYSIIEGGF
jgi:energy-coupling factor transporter ATP-binding protein EcfA2